NRYLIQRPALATAIQERAVVFRRSCLWSGSAGAKETKRNCADSLDVIGADRPAVLWRLGGGERFPTHNLPAPACPTHSAHLCHANRERKRWHRHPDEELFLDRHTLMKCQTTAICFRRSPRNRLLGIMAWTPRTMSTTWVTRKLTAMLHRA